MIEQTSTPTEDLPSATRPGRADPTLAIVGAATLLVLIVFTTVVTTVAETAQSFHAAVAGQTWALGGMSLGLAGALLTAGALADVLGRRRIFVLSSVALAASSALATISPSMLVFVLARVLQGAGIVLGPLLGAGLSLAAGWRSAYGLVAVAAVTLAGVSLRLAEFRENARARRLDPPGALAMVIAMMCATAAVISGRSSWTSSPTAILSIAAAAALVAFTTIETRRRDPMLDLRLDE